MGRRTKRPPTVGTLTEEATQVREEVGERLRALRLAAGLTQDQAAAAARMHVRQMPRIESGLVWPRLSTLIALARLYGVRVRVVFGG